MLKLFVERTCTGWFLGAIYRSSLSPGELVIFLGEQPYLKEFPETRKVCSGSYVKVQGVPETGSQHSKSAAA